MKQTCPFCNQAYEVAETHVLKSCRHCHPSGLMEIEVDPTYFYTYGGMNMTPATIIVGFPGIGKSTTAHGWVTLDHESSEYSWIEKGMRNPLFPENYIAAIKENLYDYDFIFVSSHDIVREALHKADLPYVLVFPDISLKDEYLARYETRGSDPQFIQLMDDNWDSFYYSVANDVTPYKFVLSKGTYLVDALHYLDLELDGLAAFHMTIQEEGAK